MKRLFLPVLLALGVVSVAAQPATIGDFFDRFTAEWVRQNPNQAVGARYFTGVEQQALERQLTPATDAWARSRRDLAKRGLAELVRFDRSRLNKTDRLSAELMQWQLQIVVDGVPGHHFQIALEMENKDEPRFRRIRAFGGIPAVTEGWGLYAERLAAESGWYDGDVEGRLGQLDAELFRARRLVVDTGIHAKHWTRQPAIDYGIEASEVEPPWSSLKALPWRTRSKRHEADGF